MDKQQKGTDHQLSLEPNEFAEMISYIRNAECCRTDDMQIEEIFSYIAKLPVATEMKNVKLALKRVAEKKILDCEIPCRMKLGKSLVYAMHLNAGSILTADMICAKVNEPFGIAAEHFNDFIGRKLLIDVEFEENLMENHLIE